MTCALKGEKIYFYGGYDKQQIYNKKIYSVKLEGLELRNQKAKWKFEETIKNMSKMESAKAFSLSNNSNEIVNFGGRGQVFSFNILDINNYKIRNNTKGLQGLLKILKLPNGLESVNGFDKYFFVQSDKDPFKFYLLNSWLIDKDGKVRYINILIYDALKNAWKDTKLSFHVLFNQITVTHKGLIYLINEPSIDHKASNGYIIDVEKSRIVKIKIKGDIPSENFFNSYLKYENQIIYLVNNGKTAFLTIYTLDLDNFIWKKQNIHSIGIQTYPCLVYYKGYIVITFGNMNQDNDYTQIIDTKTWTKVFGINMKKETNNSDIPTNEIENNQSNDNGNQNIKESTNKSTLIGGLIGSGIFIGFIIVFIYIYFKRKKEISYIKPPEFITQHEIINVLDPKEDKKPLSFRFSIKSNKSKNNDDWDLKEPEAIYSLN